MTAERHQEEQEIVFTAVGDVCLGQAAREKILAHGVGFPFELVQAEWSDSNLRFGNLECVFPGNIEMVTEERSDLWSHDGAIKSLNIAKLNRLNKLRLMT